MSPGSAEDDDCLCQICRFQCGSDLLPVPSITSLDDLLSQAQSLSFKVFRDWVHLNKILKRFEACIQKRWTRRNNSQRLTVLLHAWPGMASTHRPDFAKLRRIGNNNTKQRPNREKEREAFLWPYINQEDLVQPHNLLLFLSSRGRHLPDKFVFGDQQTAHCGDLESCNAEDVQGFRMSLYGKRTPKSYGSLIPCGKADGGQDLLRMHPSAGLQVLQCQQRILAFLVDCCRYILHDVDLDQLNLLPTHPSPPSVQPRSGDWPTVTNLAKEAPYRLPQRLDLNRIEILVRSKREEAEEHMWTLREDPGYFAHNLREWSDHSGAVIPDRYRQRHGMFGNSQFWSDVTTGMILHAYSNVVLWAAADGAIRDIRKGLGGCSQMYESCDKLPASAARAFRQLDFLVGSMKEGPLNDLVVGFPASPAMRNGFERKFSDPQQTFHELKVVLRKSSPSWRLYILFQTLLSHDQQMKHGLSNIVEEIQRVLDENSRDSGMISEWVANRFSDLALVVEIRRQIDLFQPHVTAWRYGSEEEEECPDYICLLDCVTGLINCVGVDGHGPSAFTYPSDKRKSEQTVTKMRRAEERLDDLWDCIDHHCEHHTGRPVNFVLMDSLKEWDRRLHRTPKWIDPEKTSRPQEEEKEGEEEDVETEQDQRLSLYELDPHARCSRPTKSALLEGATQHRVKPKTRPMGRPIQAQPKKEVDEVKEEEEVQTLRIKVNKRAYKVFATLFHVPSANEQQNQGEVAWTEFLYAMSSVGFSPEKLYGSSWQFTPTDIDVSRSIQIHEPHPHAKLHYWLAKRAGRRLNRAYGWNGETFVCK